MVELDPLVIGVCLSDVSRPDDTEFRERTKHGAVGGIGDGPAVAPFRQRQSVTNQRGSRGRVNRLTTACESKLQTMRLRGIAGAIEQMLHIHPPASDGSRQCRWTVAR